MFKHDRQSGDAEDTSEEESDNANKNDSKELIKSMSRVKSLFVNGIVSTFVSTKLLLIIKNKSNI